MELTIKKLDFVCRLRKSQLILTPGQTGLNVHLTNRCVVTRFAVKSK